MTKAGDNNNTQKGNDELHYDQSKQAESTYSKKRILPDVFARLEMLHHVQMYYELDKSVYVVWWLEKLSHLNTLTDFTPQKLDQNYFRYLPQAESTHSSLQLIEKKTVDSITLQREVKARQQTTDDVILDYRSLLGKKAFQGVDAETQTADDDIIPDDRSLLGEKASRAVDAGTQTTVDESSLISEKAFRAVDVGTQTAEDDLGPDDASAIGEETFQSEATKTEVIGSAGGSIELYGCKVDFPRDALKEDTVIQLSVDNDPMNFPKQGITITPVMSIKPHMEFDVPVKVSMKTSCKARKGKVTAQVWSRESSDDDWAEYKKVPLGSESIVRFTVNHFSDKISTAAKNEDVIHTVNNSIFIMQEQATLSSVFWLDEKSMHDVCNGYQKLDYVKARPVDLVMESKEEDSYEIKVKCVSPGYMEYESRRGNPAEFTVSRKFIRTRRPIAIEFHSEAVPDDGTKKLRFNYSVQLCYGEEDPDNDCSFEIKWPVKIKNHGSKTKVTVNNTDVHGDKISDSTFSLQSGS